MLLSDKFKFGKYKDQTLESVLSSEQGRDYLHWYIKQPCQKAEFSDYDRVQKESIARKLAQQEGHFRSNDMTSTMYLAGEIENLKERVEKLEQGVQKSEHNDPEVKNVMDTFQGTPVEENNGWT